MNAELIKESFKELAPAADVLTDRFFEALFDEHPQWKSLFDRVDLEDHRQRFARGLAVTVRLADDDKGLKWFSEQLGARHVNYGAGSVDFSMATDILQRILAEQAGPKLWTTECANAWNRLLKDVADAMQAGAAEASLEVEDWDDDPTLVGAGAVVADQQQQPERHSETSDLPQNSES